MITPEFRFKMFALNLIALLVLFSKMQAQEKCGTVFRNESLMKMHPELDSVYRSQERVLEYTSSPSAVVTIPVVFHVIYNTPSQQVSYTLLNQAVDVLTKDFRRQNPDAGNTGKYGGYQNPNGLWAQNYSNLAADCEIEFRLCNVTYDYTSLTEINLTQNLYFLKTTYPYYQSYPPSKFLNVWVCKMGGSLLGLAEFPGSPPQQDGVTVSNSSLGYNSPDFRVLTHEVGHWLGLRHIWGDCTCCDDYVSDTTPQQNSNLIMASNPPFPSYPNQAPCAMWTACPGVNVYNNVYYPYVNMGDNFMDYSPSSCLNFFSKGQKQRMWSILNSYRPTLLLNNSCITGADELSGNETSMQIFPNPASDKINATRLKVGTPLVITNVLGMKLLETEATSEIMEIDVSQLPGGLYFLNRTRFIKE